MIDNLIDQLKRDEGERLYVYRDSKGILTAGVGHNCEAHNEGLAEGDVVTQEQVDKWLADDIQTAKTLLWQHCPWIDTLDEVRRNVLYNMIFQMGWSNEEQTHGLITFRHFLQNVLEKKFLTASEAGLKSAWAEHDSPDRAKRLMLQMLSGEWQ